MKKLEFYNVKTKKKFKSSDYYLISKNTKGGIRYFAVTRNGGIDVYKLVSQDFYLNNL